MSTASVPGVSVVITAYNRARIIRRAIDSVMRQTMDDFELIVVDDASQDDTVAVVEGLGIERLRLVRNPVNRGIGGAKNAGILAARGTYVAFLDSDDEWLPEKLGRQVAAMRRRPDIPLSFTAFELHRESGNALVRRPQRRGSWLTAILSGEYTSFGSTLLATRACFDAVGLLSEELSRIEDRDWMLRYFDHYDDFICLDEPLARIHNSGWPRADAVERSVMQLFERHRARLAERGRDKVDLFRASLEYEIAVAYYRCGDYGRSLRHLGAAATARPSYLGLMARRGLRKLLERDYA